MSSAPVSASSDALRAIADAVLYEGYILWPYRRSAMKNQRRFTFGGVYPPAQEAAHPDDRSWMQTEVLLEGSADATVEVTVRFLHVVQRTAARLRDGALEHVDELLVAGQRHLSWDEAVEREIDAPALTLSELQRGHRVAIVVAGATEQEVLRDERGARAGALIRTWAELSGELQLRAAQLGSDSWRITARIINETPSAAASRQAAIKQTFCSTHTLMRVHRGEFASLADPPEALAAAAAACENVGTWPVPVGTPGEKSVILSSPIILEDYPRIAPESPGDLFDGGEIDQLLVLNILAMTDEEKAEMAATDPRAREILERTETLTPEQLMALHGAVREFGMSRSR